MIRPALLSFAFVVLGLASANQQQYHNNGGGQFQRPQVLPAQIGGGGQFQRPQVLPAPIGGGGQYQQAQVLPAPISQYQPVQVLPGPIGQSTGGCGYYCKGHTGKYVCCDHGQQNQKLGRCPPVRPTCPRFGQPPKVCVSDRVCHGQQKCCFDRCLNESVCKNALGLH